MSSPEPEIVFVIPSLGGGGAELIVQQVARTLAGAVPVEVVVLLDGPPGSEVTSDGLVITRLAQPRIRNGIWAAVRLLRKRRPAAVVTTLKHISTGVALVDWLLPPRCRHVARIANTYSAELLVLPRRRRALMEALIRWTHRRIDHFICVSEGVRSDLVEHLGLPPSRCTVVYNPVDIESLASMASAPMPPLPKQAVDARVRYLSVGRLSPQKDHATLLRAFASVRTEIDAALLIAGEGSERRPLEDLARELGVDDAVHFLGYLENPYPLFRMSDALVLSSRFEGMPNVLLEALALGLPCVSTDCPHGPAEILVGEELGCLVPVGDAHAMSRAMRLAPGSGDPEARRRRVASAHDPDQVAAAYRAAIDATRGDGRSLSESTAATNATLVANMGFRSPPNGQSAKSRQLLALLHHLGAQPNVVDVDRAPWRLARLACAIRRGDVVTIALNRRGLWVALVLARAVRPIATKPPTVTVAVVGGWLPDSLRDSSVYRRIAQGADVFLAETPRAVEALRAQGLNAHEMVNFRDLPIDQKRVRDQPSDPLRLCFAGRIRHDKGIIEAARLVDELRSRSIPATLDIYGPIEDADSLERALQVSACTYRGQYSTAEEALEVFSSYDFLILPTTYAGECMPGAVVEAAFAGLPSVVSDWNDLDQVVIDGVTGFVCGHQDFTTEAAGKIELCLQMGGLPALSRQALQRAEARFTVSEASREFLTSIPRFGIDPHGPR